MSDAIETPTQGAPADADAAGQRVFTQEEFEAELGKRVFRERNKYADYDELKAKAEKYDEAQEASKSALQKAEDERDKLKAKLKALEDAQARAAAVAKAAEAHGVDAELLGRMEGDVESNALFLKERGDAAPKYQPVADAGEAKAPPAERTTGAMFEEALASAGF